MHVSRAAACNSDVGLARLLEDYPTSDWARWGVLGARLCAHEGASAAVPRLIVTIDGSRPRPWGRTVNLPMSDDESPAAVEVEYRLGEAISVQAGPRVTAAAAEVPRAGALIEAVADGRRAVGTLGWIFMGRDDRCYMMSNWHVLCAGAPKTRAGRVHLARSGRPFATLHAYAQVAADEENTWDLAVARFDDDSEAHGGFAILNPEVPRHVPVSLAPPLDGDLYYKVGATTGYRDGRFAGVGAHRVAFGSSWRFRRLLFFERDGRSRFSHDGDSGSVVVHAESNAACALLLGGFVTKAGSVGVGSPIHAAFRAIGTVRTRTGEVLPRLDYPARDTRDPLWVTV